MNALVTLATAVALDLVWGEPPARFHPVVWMGKLVAALERRAPAGERARLAYGACLVPVVLACVALPAWWLERALGKLGLVGALLLGVCLKPAFAVRELLRAAERVGASLEAGDLPAAREWLTWLVSRDTRELDAPLLAAAAIESVAENASDSAVAPLLCFGLFGLAGAMAYRAANTMDAMLGYRTERYEQLGKTAARLDDALNVLPSRLTGALVVCAAAVTGGSVSQGWRVMRRDAGLTASPNAGWPMAATAGALGVRLEKVGHYRLHAGGREPAPHDVARGVALIRTALALGLVPIATLTWRRGGR
ncbi:MAG TPA: adenosylcobinamide-phosphate synthase CbiB [Chloroflexota bacterium]|nr:adenosylcobinamide-phosphate synthase CbiB [Chloroflexota bacterium]